MGIPPTEPLFGQDPEPPDIRLVARAVRTLLADCDPFLQDHPDLRLRIAAARTVLRRVIKELEDR